MESGYLNVYMSSPGVYFEKQHQLKREGLEGSMNTSSHHLLPLSQARRGSLGGTVGMRVEGSSPTPRHAAF
jgi:hypothetical protein